MSYKPKPPEVSQHQIETNSNYAALYLLAIKLGLKDIDLPQNKTRSNTDITDILQTISTQASAVLHDKEALVREKGVVEMDFAVLQEELDQYRRPQ